MKLIHLDEPELEFGAGRHVDIRFGIMNHGPLDIGSSLAPRQIPVGVIGTRETIEGVHEWFDKCRSEIAAKTSKQPHLFPRFPGFSEDNGFRCSVVMNDALVRDIPKSRISDLAKIADLETRIREAVELFLSEIRYLAENTAARVILCALPLELLKSMQAQDADDEQSPVPSTPTPVDFHDLLKAKAMQYRKPIQLVLPSTYDESKHRSQQRTGRKRTLQDAATRAWNIHSALYYKADGIPWRLRRESSDLTVCYVGVSFYRSLDKTKLQTSVAQVFNERGEGVVVRGGAATISKLDRQPHLEEGDAHDLIRNALIRYREVHKNLPARVVVHKSSRFNVAEISGFEAALSEERIDSHDFLSLSDTTGGRLFRNGVYPPLRGSMLALDDKQMLLYTRGSVQFFETYPGLYVPVPLLIRSESAEETQKFLAKEILALTKMNWNNTQFDGSEPVTLRAARQVSSVLRYCDENTRIEPKYSFYM